MDSDVLPKNQEELEGFIIKTVNEKYIPYVSADKQKEIEELHKDALDEEYNSNDYMKL